MPGRYYSVIIYSSAICVSSRGSSKWKSVAAAIHRKITSHHLYYNTVMRLILILPSRGWKAELTQALQCLCSQSISSRFVIAMLRSCCFNCIMLRAFLLSNELFTYLFPSAKTKTGITMQQKTKKNKITNKRTMFMSHNAKRIKRAAKLSTLVSGWWARPPLNPTLERKT